MLETIFEHANRVNIFDRQIGFTDSQGNYFGRFTIEIDPYGRNEIRCDADSLVALLDKALFAVKERDKGL
jgi:hypothetical protein